MISLNKDMPVFPGRPGVSERRPIHDPSVLDVQEWTFDPGVTFTPHAHATAQIVYMIKGKCRFKLEGSDEEVLLEPGCYYFTPAGAAHDITEIIEQTTMLIVSPPKKKK
jgi:quercetin dioxygenase-like cupin family protein